MYRRLKPTLDYVFSFLLLIILSPLLLLIAVAIVIDSGFPIFYNQKRVGYFNEVFLMYKFRTMVPNADKYDVASSTLATKGGGDGRVTKVGAILRSTSLDELPQLLNVLKGDMSLIGPRCLSIKDTQKFPIECKDRLYYAKPGITGLWQVASSRWNLSLQEIYDLDMSYSKNVSLKGDINIILLTIKTILFKLNK